mmetsp:Transcript_34100/g.104746  ORF Transcript_34100/g.104746 Transcript_34100/m.104746 type:complete len:242 (-) Transcript_34100:796-1521(-)
MLFWSACVPGGGVAQAALARTEARACEAREDWRIREKGLVDGAATLKAALEAARKRVRLLEESCARAQAVYLEKEQVAHRLAARAARRMARAPLARAWTAWARETAAARARATFFAHVSHRAAAAARRYVLIRWWKFAQHTRCVLFSEVRSAELLRARVERRALQCHYRGFLWRSTLRRRAHRWLEGAWCAWWCAVQQADAVAQRRRRLANAVTRRALGRCAAESLPLRHSEITLCVWGAS